MSRPKKSKDTRLVAVRIESEDIEAILIKLETKSISEAVRCAIKHLITKEEFMNRIEKDAK